MRLLTSSSSAPETTRCREAWHTPGVNACRVNPLLVRHAIGGNLHHVRVVLSQPRIDARRLGLCMPVVDRGVCVGDIACGALGMTLISCSRTAVQCETRTSPAFMFDNDPGISFFTTLVWAARAISAVRFST